MNCSAGPTSFPWTFNNTGIHELSFGWQFKMFICLVLGRCSVNHPLGDMTAEDDKWAGKSISNGGVLLLSYCDVFGVKNVYCIRFLYFGNPWDVWTVLLLEQFLYLSKGSNGLWWCECL